MKTSNRFLLIFFCFSSKRTWPFLRLFVMRESSCISQKTLLTHFSFFCLHNLRNTGPYSFGLEVVANESFFNLKVWHWCGKDTLNKSVKGSNRIDAVLAELVDLCVVIIVLEALEIDLFLSYKAGQHTRDSVVELVVKVKLLTGIDDTFIWVGIVDVFHFNILLVQTWYLVWIYVLLMILPAIHKHHRVGSWIQLLYIFSVLLLLLPHKFLLFPQSPYAKRFLVQI